jgi:hypothetical protein
MTNEIEYPFEFNNAFFISINAQRQPDPPERAEYEMKAELKIIDVNLPDQLQINVLLRTTEDTRFSLVMELVGLFKYLGDNIDNDRVLITDFINNRALFILWPFLVQMGKLLTTQMGITSFIIPIPQNFSFVPQSSEKDCD